MKVITKPKLPKWLIFILPFNEEEYILKAIIIPLILFLFLWIGTVSSEFLNDLFHISGIFATIIFLSLTFASIWWLLLQIDVLHALRLRFKLHYEVTKDEEEKLKTKKRLSDLCVRSKRLKT